MSTQAETVALPPRFRWRRVSLRLGDFPLIPTLILAGVAFVAIFANVLAPHNPEVGSLVARFKPPFWETGGSAKYLLGTDQLGRDVLSRLIFGARVSMVVGFTAVIFAGVIGTALGILSGYLGGWVDQVIMRLTDTWLALPALTFAIFLAAIVGPSMWNIVIILGITYWTRYARVIRGEVLSLKEREFVRLAIVAGCSKWTIMRRHILPNVINSAIVLGSLMLGVVIITEATLSFLLSLAELQLVDSSLVAFRSSFNREPQASAPASNEIPPPAANGNGDGDGDSHPARTDTKLKVAPHGS